MWGREIVLVRPVSRRVGVGRGGPFPGALPPATLSIPFGDSQNTYAPCVQQKIWDTLSVWAGR